MQLNRHIVIYFCCKISWVIRIWLFDYWLPWWGGELMERICFFLSASWFYLVEKSITGSFYMHENERLHVVAVKPPWTEVTVLECLLRWPFFINFPVMLKNFDLLYLLEGRSTYFSVKVQRKFRRQLITLGDLSPYLTVSSQPRCLKNLGRPILK